MIVDESSDMDEAKQLTELLESRGKESINGSGRSKTQQMV